jgi:hypothetical protein
MDTVILITFTYFFFILYKFFKLLIDYSLKIAMVEPGLYISTFC